MKRSLATLFATALTASATAADDGTDRHALTLYSTMSPGAVNPEHFRGGNRDAVPGYAVVRHEREIDARRAATTCASPTSPDSSTRPR